MKIWDKDNLSVCSDQNLKMKVLFYRKIMAIYLCMLFIICLCCVIFSFGDMFTNILLIMIIITSVILFFFVPIISKVLYYHQCLICDYSYSPSYIKLLFYNKRSPFLDKMRCPNCGKRSYHRERKNY